MFPPAELRGEQWTRPTYGRRAVTVTPETRTTGPVGDVQPLLDLAVVMAESDDVEAILELAMAAVPTLAASRCLGVRGSSDSLPDGDDCIAYPLRTASFDHGFLLVAPDRVLRPEEDGRLRLLTQQTAVALSGARRMAKHRKDAYELARANVALSRVVDELRRTVEIHARLDEVATSGAGLEGLAATLHAAAGMPNFLITEYFVNFEDAARAIARRPLRVEGSHIALPTDPGLGIDLDEDALARHPYREPSPRGLRRPEDE